MSADRWGIATAGSRDSPAVSDLTRLGGKDRVSGAFFHLIAAED